MAKKVYSACLKADRRFLEAERWIPWLNAAARTRADFANFIEYDPMSNETASMGVLASAATRAGLLATTEFVCQKHQPDHRRKLRNGRLDLWVGDPKIKRSWAFEAKQIRCRNGTREGTLKQALSAACHDAWHLPSHEGDRFFGILVATLPEEGDGLRVRDTLREFRHHAEFAWEVGGGSQPAFVFIKSAEKKQRA